MSKSSTPSGAHFHNVYGNIVIFQGPDEQRKRAYSGAMKGKNQTPAKKAKKPKTDQRICFWQEACKRPSGQCHFRHLPEKYLVGKMKPYKLCYAFPDCTRESCPYVHWTGGEAEEDCRPSEFQLPNGGQFPASTYYDDLLPLSTSGEMSRASHETRALG